MLHKNETHPVVYLETCESIIQAQNGEGKPDSDLDSMFDEWDREDDALEMIGAGPEAPHD